MTKLHFEDLNGEKEWIDLDFVSDVKLYKCSKFYRIEFWGHSARILSYYKISNETMKTVSEKISKYFNGYCCWWFQDKTIPQSQKPEKAIIQFSDEIGINHKLPAEDFKHLSCQTDDSGNRKLLVKFRNFAPFRITKEIYDLFEEYIDEGGLDDKNSLQI